MPKKLKRKRTSGVKATQTSGSSSKLSRLPYILTSGYLMLMLTAFLLWVRPDCYETIAGIKYHVFLVIHGVYFALMFFYFICKVFEGAVTPASMLKKLAHCSMCHWLALCYLGITWVSAFQSKWFPDTVHSLLKDLPYATASLFTIYVVVFFLLSVYGTATKWHAVVLCVSSIVYSIIGIIQSFDIDIFSLYGNGETFSGDVINGQYCTTIGNTNLVALLTVMILALSVFAVIRAEGKNTSIISCICGLIRGSVGTDMGAARFGGGYRGCGFVHAHSGL